ncbi:MAG: endolytic transglycosylase MltG [Deltaproteobacteria bacterium]|nr:endolytic transglycosylase MltG [Deltaproteobacteria bacterium]
MASRIRKIIFFLFVLFLGLLIPFCVHLGKPVSAISPIINIEKGMSLRQISHVLEEQRIVSNGWFFLLYAHLRGKGESIKAGEYDFSETSSPRQVLKRLVKGLVRTYPIQIVEGWSLTEIARSITATGPNRDPTFIAEFSKLTRDKNFITSLGLSVNSLEGYLFPDTYNFNRQETPRDYLRTFVEEFKRNYSALLDEEKPKTFLNQHQIVTLASIIEKETGKEEERPIVASVFYNRLKIGMPLQSDPTIIYGLKNFDGNIRKKDILNPHPYNTYVHRGIPPGPIASPGKNSLRAALFPATTTYLYFVSRNDGTHHFSSTGAEHVKAVQKYQSRRGNGN